MIELQAVRGKEMATKRTDGSTKLRRTSVRDSSGVLRSEMLPADPMEVVKILKERRAKKSPAMRAKDRMAAEAAKRGIRRVGN